jgi:hypothetical protein
MNDKTPLPSVDKIYPEAPISAGRVKITVPVVGDLSVTLPC